MVQWGITGSTWAQSKSNPLVSLLLRCIRLFPIHVFTFTFYIYIYTNNSSRYPNLVWQWLSSPSMGEIPLSSGVLLLFFGPSNRFDVIADLAVVGAIWFKCVILLLVWSEGSDCLLPTEFLLFFCWLQSCVTPLVQHGAAFFSVAVWSYQNWTWFESQLAVSRSHCVAVDDLNLADREAITKEETRLKYGERAMKARAVHESVWFVWLNRFSW